MPLSNKQEGNGPVLRASRQYTEAVEAVEFKSDFKFELIDLNYPRIINPDPYRV